MRIGSVMLFPIMPNKTNQVLDSLDSNDNFDSSFGILKEQIRIKPLKNIFPRIIK